MNHADYHILVVDDDPGMRLGMVETLKRQGFRVDQGSDAFEGLAKIEENSYQAIVTDMRMPRISGLDFLKKAKQICPGTEILVVTAYGTIQNAIEAMKFGAFDYILKPFSPKDIVHAVENAVTKKKPIRGISNEQGSSNFISKSPKVLEILDLAKRAAQSKATILIQAESGTGKELMAQYIVGQSDRADKPVVAVNCAALPDNLLESELFGYEKGSFTGALHAKPGKFEYADGGTLLLDEIGEMPLALQSKLLRAIQEEEVDRIGSRSPKKVNVRIIAMTNQNLQSQIKEGSFREDLFFRLNVIPLNIPPLRQRPEDIEPLCQHFFEKYNARPKTSLDPSSLNFLKRYPWPGNVRELENTIQRAVVLCQSDRIEPKDLWLSNAQQGENQDSGAMLKAGQTVQQMERKLIEITLEETMGNRTHAAKMLGISLRTLRNKLNEYKAEEN